MSEITPQDRSNPAILCPPCGIDLHGQCWWFDGDKTADGPCQCSCHADHVQFVAGADSGSEDVLSALRHKEANERERALRLVSSGWRSHQGPVAHARGKTEGLAEAIAILEAQHTPDSGRSTDVDK